MRTLIIILCISETLFSQSRIVKGFIFDDITKQPIPYVNLSILNSQKGTSSDNDGSYRIEIDENDFQKNVHLSSLGYKDSVISVIQFVNKDQIFLKAKIETLNEIVISKKFEERFLVVNPIRKKDIKSGFGGSEHPLILALYFPYQDKYEFIKNLNNVKIYLKNYWFEENRPSKFRLRILSVGDNGLPDKDLLSESIIVETVKNQKEVIIDVSEYDLIFSKSGLYIGLEWLYIPFNEYEQVFTVDGEKGRKTMKRFAPRFSLTYEEVNKYKVAVFSNGKWIEEVLPSFNGNEQIVPAISLTLSN